MNANFHANSASKPTKAVSGPRESNSAPSPDSALDIALVLAGSRRPFDPVAAAANKSLKAFVPIAGRSMVERVAATLQATERFQSIQICLPRDLPVDEDCPWLAAALRQSHVTRVNAAESPAASVLGVLETLPAGATLLVTTADHPLLDVAMVSAFFAGMAAEPADGFAAVTDVKTIRDRYPEMRRTAFKFRDAAYTGCNLFALTRAAIPVVRFFQQIETHRKQPLRLAHHVGYGTLLRYLTGRLTLDDVLSQIRRTTGVRLQVIRLQDPNAGIDVDTVDDLAAVQAIVGSR